MVALHIPVLHRKSILFAIQGKELLETRLNKINTFLMYIKEHKENIYLVVLLKRNSSRRKLIAANKEWTSKRV